MCSYNAASTMEGNPRSMNPTQCKMARAALGWSVLELASKAGVNKNTVVNFENGKDAYTSTVDRLVSAFEQTGRISFGEGGCVCAGEA